MSYFYKVFNYNKEQKEIIEYLLSICETLEILDRIDEALFQFHPTITETGHEPWFNYHKYVCLNEILFKLLESTITDEYILDYEINEVIWKDKYKEFYDTILENKDSFKVKDNIISKYKEKYKEIGDLNG